MELSQNQQQMLSFRMVQSMNILQMGIQELRELVVESVQENPVLDLPEPAEVDRAARELSRKLEWLHSFSRKDRSFRSQDDDADEYDPLSGANQYIDEDKDLRRYILSQFHGIWLDPEVMRCIEFLVERLDSRGFLDEELASLAQLARTDPWVMERALTELQAADPAGIGARSLPECLRLQIERRSGDHRVAVAIAEHYLEDLSRDRYGRISRAIGASEQEVRDACDLIRTLNPHPASGFASSDHLTYIIPDVLVTAEHAQLVVTVNHSAIPQLKLNGYYLSLLRQTDDAETRAYLTDKAAKAKWLVQSIAQRQDTLLRCAQFIAAHQESFFRRGPAYLLPLTMEETARALNVHESTISRTVKDKYLQCARGIYPMSYFFSRALGSQDTSAQAVKELLKQLVKEEPAEKPLSDQKLCEALEEMGCCISRRTVAKYRDELGIPSASGRKQRR